MIILAIYGFLLPLNTFVHTYLLDVLRNFFFLLFLFCWNEALSARSDHCKATRCRIRGVTEVVGEMDVSRVKPKTPATRDAFLQPEAAAYCPSGNPRSPLPWWTTSTRPGARRAMRGRG